MPFPDTVISLPFTDPPRLDVSGAACLLALVPTQPGEQPFLECDERLAALFKPVVDRDGEVVRVRLELAGAAHWGANTRSPFPFGFWDFGPRVAMTLHVPVAVRARIQLDAGKIRVRGLSGCELDIQSSAGLIIVRDVDGRLKINQGAGKILGENLSGSLDVQSNAGAARLELGKLAAGRHQIHSTLGAVVVQIAPGQKVQVDARATMGSVKNSYPSAAGAETTLDIQTEFGSVKVFEGDGMPEPRHPEGRHEGRHHPERKGAWSWQWPGGGFAWGHGGPWRGPPESPRPPAPPPGGASDEELKRILNMVKEGKLTPEEAQKLLRAMEQPKR
jgi:hypothetical protein